MTSLSERRGFVPRSLLAAGASLAMVVVLSLLLMGERQTPGSDGGGKLILYCAAGIIKPVRDAAQEYEKEFGVSVQLDPGGSGELMNRIQIAKGSANLYLAADNWYVEETRRRGLAREILTVAHIHPVIVLAPGNPPLGLFQ